jgi:hypothetical protein
MTSETLGSGDFRRSQIKEGVVLTIAPFLSIFVLGPLSQVFSRPNPWPVRGFIGFALISGTVCGPLGLKRINRGRDGRYDALGILCLALVLGGTLLYLFFLGLALILYGLSSYGLVPFGGR